MKVAQSLYLTSSQRQILQKNLETNLRPEFRRRIHIMLLTDAGESQTNICKKLGCSQEAARYWISIVKTGQFYKWNDSPIGRPKVINEQYIQRLKELATSTPREYGYAFQRWTAHWLKKHLEKELGISVSNYHISRLLKSMGLSTRSKNKSQSQV
ncbi:MAG: helix-turn-helix domain-containing protein [Rivularia sp. (in: cyanobacteria)]